MHFELVFEGLPQGFRFSSTLTLLDFWANRIIPDDDVIIHPRVEFTNTIGVKIETGDFALLTPVTVSLRPLSFVPPSSIAVDFKKIAAEFAFEAVRVIRRSSSSSLIPMPIKVRVSAGHGVLEFEEGKNW